MSHHTVKSLGGHFNVTSRSENTPGESGTAQQTHTQWELVGIGDVFDLEQPAAKASVKGGGGGKSVLKLCLLQVMLLSHMRGRICSDINRSNCDLM